MSTLPISGPLDSVSTDLNVERIMPSVSILSNEKCVKTIPKTTVMVDHGRVTDDLVDKLMVSSKANNPTVDVSTDIELEANKQTFDKGSSFADEDPLLSELQSKENKDVAFGGDASPKTSENLSENTSFEEASD